MSDCGVCNQRIAQNPEGTCTTSRETWAREHFRERQMERLGALEDFTDDMLTRLRRNLRRETSDLARAGHIGEARHRWVEAREVRQHQLWRFRLWMRYGAVDDVDGTLSMDCYYRHSQAPGYSLAILIDYARAAQGRSHVLDWAENLARAG